MIATRLAMVLAAGAAGSSMGAFVSFASDSNPDRPTFRSDSYGRNIMDGNAGVGIGVTLLYDADDNGPGTAVSYTSNLQMQFDFHSYSAVAVAGGATLHTYVGHGHFDFRDAFGSALLSVAAFDIVLTSLSDSTATLGTSATIQANHLASSFPFVGGLLTLGNPVMTDFAFTLTNMREASGSNVGGLDNNGYWNPWTSEGSFSGTLVPTPGTIGLVTLGAMLAMRRHRN
ncbi:MAG: hypothetical protein AABZ53_10225 [Planctomycetota bacterium]